MQMTQLVSKLGRNDVRLIGRDSFLIFMFFFVIGLGLLLAFGVPTLNAYLTNNGVLPNDYLQQSLADWYPMIVTYIGIYTAGGVLIGTIFGFMLLDEKDDNTLKAMLVTPISLSQYVLYRVGLPAILAFVIIVAMVLWSNLAALPLWQLLLIAGAGALTAPFVSLFFAVFAENKVQGFAYSKFVSLFGWTIMFGWFVPEPFQYLLGLFPPFWVSKAYWMAFNGSSWWWVAFILAIVTQVGLIAFLVQRFREVAYK